jgi:hypothetical protein
LFYKVEESEIGLPNEETLREEFLRLKNATEGLVEVEDSNIDELRVAILQEAERVSPQIIENFNDYLDKQLSVFKEGENYEYVKDLKDAFKNGLAESEASKIFNTIPAHAFWDIKTPRTL